MQQVLVSFTVNTLSSDAAKDQIKALLFHAGIGSFGVLDAEIIESRWSLLTAEVPEWVNDAAKAKEGAQS